MLLLQVVVQSPVGGAHSGDSTLVHPDGSVPSTIRAVRAEEAPTLDGYLDEDVWRRAAPATGFRRDRPGDGAPAAERTEVRLAFTSSALYVGARMHDRRPERISRLRGRRDSFSQQNDQFLVMIDSYHDHRTAFVFGVTPAGGRNDLIAPNDGLEDMDPGWDPVWDVTTRVDSAGWIAEIRIPFSQLRFPEGPEQLWGINFRRDILHAGEAVDWNWRPATEAGWASKFGHLVGLEGIPRPGRLEVLPYVVTHGAFDQSADAADPFDDGSVLGGSVGLDLKYGLTSALTLDATVNPDFGQVEADPAVVNLTAFETFFQERRPFFVEGSSLFDFGGLQSLRFFYSRRIGQQPALSASGDGTYVDQPAASTILGAAKLSGKTESGWGIGVLNATTQREVARISDVGVAGTREAPVDPLTNTTAVRVRKEFAGGGSYVGIMGTGVVRDLDAPDFASVRDRAWVGGVDFLHRFGGRTHALQGWAGVTHVQGAPEAMIEAQEASARYYQRPDQDYVALDPSRTSLRGYAGELSFRRESGDWLYEIEGTAISPGFDMNDAGFQPFGDLLALVVNGRRRWLGPTRFFRNASMGMSLSEWRNFGNLPFRREVSWDGNGQTRSFRRIGASASWGFEVQDHQATRGGPAMTRPANWAVGLSMDGDGRNRISGGLGLRYSGDVEGGYGLSVLPRLQGRGQGWFSWSLRPSLNWSRAPAFYVTQGEDPAAEATFGRRYVFAGLDQTSIDLTARMDMALTPRMTLQVYAQPFVATGDYEGFGALAAPGTFEFLRYGEGPSTLALVDGAYSADADGAGAAVPLEFDDPDFRVRSFRSNVVLRWEYLPGSTLFLVWSQDRERSFTDPSSAGPRDLRRLFSDPMRNVFLVKATWWLDF